MCGIAGIINIDLSPVQEADLWRMGDAIAHRGPDNKGVIAHDNLGLAYRRLSIIDTTEQAQPILSNPEQNLFIAFNGEIYNFSRLKHDLTRDGHRFYTQTDTEVVLHLYMEYGPECVRMLNGIFAFAILNTRDNSMFIARDQLGVKPLYYMRESNRLLFASEIKAILADDSIPRKINHDALGKYFRYRFVPDPETMFEGILRLPPAHWMKIADGKVKIQHYWSIRSTMDSPLGIGHSEKEIVGQVRETLLAATERQMVADVPVGAFLSGGVDSSIVVGLMSRLSKEPLKTFSIGFTESKYDEMSYAKQISDKYQTDHHEITLTPDHVKSLKDVVWHLDEPLADPAALPSYFLSEMARKEVTVVLTGEGGDELFAGYKEDFNYRLSSWLRVMPDWARRLVSETISDLPAFNGKTRLYRSFLPDRNRAEHILFDLFRFDEPPVLQSGSRQYEYNHDRYLDYSFDYFWQKAEGLDWLTKMLYLETKIWLPGDPLMKVDKMTMAHGLEARVPILDLEVVELAAKISSRLKNKDGIEKYLLRQAFADFLPDEIFNRPKTAFELPVGEWLRSDLQPLIDEYLSEERLMASTILDTNRTREIVQQHLAGTRDYKYEIWALLVFQIWYEKWFG